MLANNKFIYVKKTNSFENIENIYVEGENFCVFSDEEEIKIKFPEEYFYNANGLKFIIFNGNLYIKGNVLIDGCKYTNNNFSLFANNVNTINNITFNLIGGSFHIHNKKYVWYYDNWLTYILKDIFNIC